MLALIEAFLVSQMQADPLLRREPRPVILNGAAQPPRSGGASCLAVWARRLRTVLSDPEFEATERRSPARLVRRLALTADRQRDAAGRSFVLPDDAYDERIDDIAEVTVAGRQLRAGGDYLRDGRTIHCLRDPGGSPSLRILGAPAPGYVEHHMARIEVVLRSWGPADTPWAEQASAADALLTRAAGIALGALAGMDVVDVAADSDAGLELRLLRPRAHLAQVRTAARQGDAVVGPCSHARLLLRGDLEMTLVRGVPVPEDGGRIREVLPDPPLGLVRS